MYGSTGTNYSHIRTGIIFCAFIVVLTTFNIVYGKERCNAYPN